MIAAIANYIDAAANYSMVLVGVCYLFISLAKFYKGDIGNGITFICYAGSLIGLYISAVGFDK